MSDADKVTAEDVKKAFETALLGDGGNTRLLTDPEEVAAFNEEFAALEKQALAVGHQWHYTRSLEWRGDNWDEMQQFLDARETNVLDYAEAIPDRLELYMDDGRTLSVKPGLYVVDNDGSVCVVDYSEEEPTDEQAPR